MALKDWTYKDNSYLKYKNKKIIKELMLTQNIISGEYEVYLDIENKRPFTKKFDTKPQALKYAKAYMRKH